ncbi:MULTISPECIES: hypothetical protein [Serratia]|uniref:hypothetical protein n=1 Tax=Serratia TaxID=613 RepID=UPI00093AD09A|nr:MULTISPECIES: hypothetical protein [Serratia]OKP18815.1 hypothetical protein BSQ40_27765 [Serratia fonticola]UAN54666.1 hypothetical protein KGP26_29330 [Serratia sp. JSRIV002]
MNNDNLVSGRTLLGYINIFHNGSQADFARHMDVTPQQVTKWISGEWIVVNHQLFSPKRDVPENISGGESAGN